MVGETGKRQRDLRNTLKVAKTAKKAVISVFCDCCTFSKIRIVFSQPSVETSLILLTAN